MRNTSRGFTLIEILVALVIFSTVATVLTRLLITSQRTTTAQTVRANLQSNLRVGSMVVPNELRMLNQADSTDIVDVSDTSITYRAMRGYYVLCEVPTSATSIKVIRVLPSPYSFDYRAPAVNDGGFLFWEGDTNKISDDKWVHVAISAKANSTCNWPPPASGTVATTSLTLTLNPGIPTGTYPLANFMTGAPLRTYEITKLTLMSSGGQNWMGMCTGSAGCAPEPVVGPLAPTNGLLITRYNDVGTVVTGNTFANRNSHRSMRIRFIGVSEQAISRGGGPTGTLGTIQDTLTTVVTLRNVKQN